MSDAERFLVGAQPETLTRAKSRKYYAVRLGKTPGIYTDWPSAQSQIIGYNRPSYKSFPTLEQAQEFLGCPTKWSRSTELNGVQSSKPKSEAPPAKKRNIGEAVGFNASFNQASSANKTIDIEIEGQTDVRRSSNLPPDQDVPVTAYCGPHSASDAGSRDRPNSQGSIPTDDQDLRVYTDGSSLRNGQHQALAGVGVYFGPNHSKYGSKYVSKSVS